MESVLQNLDANSPEQSVAALKKFNTENFKNFSLGESAEVRKKFCAKLLELLPSEDNTSIPVELQIEILISLCILSREQYGISELTSNSSIKKLLAFTGLSSDVKLTLAQIMNDNSGLALQVAQESLKCIGNVILKNESSAVACGELDTHKAILERMQLWATTTVPYDIKFFDMRVLFILTAVNSGLRNIVRDDHNGFYKLVMAVDHVMFGSTEQPACHETESDDATSLAQLVCRETVYTANIASDSAVLLSDIMKTVFNITLNWCDKENLSDEELYVFKCFTHLLRIIFVSIHPHQGNDEQRLLSHCIDAMMNSPVSCAAALLLPAQVEIDKLVQHHIDPNIQLLHSETLDKLYSDHNMAVIVSILNFICTKLSLGEVSSTLMPVIAVLRIIAAGNRVIRKFLRQELLPPLGKVESRPDIGDTLKNRLVKLMTGHGSNIESVVADLFFILCKENPKRLIKHTGYGNAAGLLMSRGMLGGAPKPREFDYSEDEDSDTEEYLQSSIDLVTGGPAPPSEPSPLDSMTDEAKEAEAEKLMGLINQLNRQGIVQMIPMDKQGNPVIEKDEASGKDKESDE